MDHFLSNSRAFFSYITEEVVAVLDNYVSKCQEVVSVFTPSPIDRGTGYCFRSISLYVCNVCIFLCFFVSKITRKQLDRFA